MPETIPDSELFLCLGYVPKLREASLDWLNCDINLELLLQAGKIGMGQES